MLTEDCKDKIYWAATLKDQLQERVQMHPCGPTHQRGKCPKHGGNNPNSFCYYAATDTAHCFSCGETIYNAVDFLMKVDGLTYPDALRSLARRYNIEIVETHLTPEAQAEANKKKSYQEVHTAACEWYQQQLFPEDSASPSTKQAAQRVLQYLHDRGLNDETIRTFQLGYGPKESHLIGKHLLGEGHSQSLLVESQLLLQDKDNILRDRMHQRLVFPLHDHHGRCIGFSGRNLVKDAPKEISKYVNSRESILFKKRQTLYGYALARTAISKSKHCYLVEGLTDVMMMHQCGLPNVVASQGTAICPEQIALIRKVCTKVTIVLDGDQAGIEATERALGLLLEGGCLCEVVTLPDGEDPASYGARYGTDALRTAVSSSIDFVQWLWDSITDQDSVEQRAACVHKVSKLLGKIQDVVYRGEYIKRAAGVMDVDRRVLMGKDASSSVRSSSSFSASSSSASSSASSSKKRWAGRKRRKSWVQEEEFQPITPLRLELGRIKIRKP